MDRFSRRTKSLLSSGLYFIVDVILEPCNWVVVMIYSFRTRRSGQRMRDRVNLHGTLRLTNRTTYNRALSRVPYDATDTWSADNMVGGIKSRALDE